MHRRIDSQDLVAEHDRLNSFLADSVGEKLVVVVGLGFVGAAMIAAVLSANNSENARYRVVGVDLRDGVNDWKIYAVQAGTVPIQTSDSSIGEIYRQSHASNSLTATWLHEIYRFADYVIVDVNLDIAKSGDGEDGTYRFQLETLHNVIVPIAERIPPETLVIIETTVPPGTTERHLQPVFEEQFELRFSGKKRPRLAHSFERVMPGQNYLRSITHYFRVVAGVDEESTDLASEFFGSFIDTEQFPLTVLSSPTASETTKILENAYRAVNIAFIQEWTEFAEAAKIDLFECLDAIRKRETHQNIMSPGFGVGGYCLTKDAMLGDWALRKMFDSDQHLSMSVAAINVNATMPDYCFRLLMENWESQNGSSLALFGVSYLPEVADVRSTPAQRFLEQCRNNDVQVWCHDPIVKEWDYAEGNFSNNLADVPENAEVAVFAVRHKEYLDLDLTELLSLTPNLKIIIDANNVFSDQSRRMLEMKGVKMLGVGKGSWSEA